MLHSFSGPLSRINRALIISSVGIEFICLMHRTLSGLDVSDSPCPENPDPGNIHQIRLPSVGLPEQVYILSLNK